MIIDMHMHPFTQRAIEVMPDWFWEHPRETFQIQDRSISFETQLADLREGGVDKAVLLAFDCEVSQGFNYSNEMVAELLEDAPDDPELVGFASVDPKKGQLGIKELEHAVEDLGLMGLKLHPNVQKFYASDREYYPLWEAAAELDIPILTHTGHTFVGGYMKYAEPLHWDDVAADFPDLDIILCHFGYPWVRQTISMAMTLDNVYVDLSGWLPKHIPGELWRHADSHLADRFMFGTDYPGIKPKEWVDGLDAVDLKPATRAKVLGENAERVIFGRS